MAKKQLPESTVKGQDAPKSESEHIKPVIVQESKEAQELKDLLQRTQANFENYRKQAEKRIIEIKEMAARTVILQLLPIIDHLELALKNSVNQQESFKEGIELIYGQLKQLLEDNHVKPLETAGQKFDPYFHEALLKIESAEPEGTIVEEFQKGFLLRGEVIRHAKVKISSGSKKAEEKEPQNNEAKTDSS
ncbi:MAG TPA: nucleotide exchange factor GrpE [Candidatus Nanoarchaeia archaeon]|nr:nucleotide exchange factor GrpE [Candidatus Nanoarchaeia archaeon]